MINLRDKPIPRGRGRIALTAITNVRTRAASFPDTVLRAVHTLYLADTARIMDCNEYAEDRDG